MGGSGSGQSEGLVGGALMKALRENGAKGEWAAVKLKWWSLN